MEHSIEMHNIMPYEALHCRDIDVSIEQLKKQHQAVGKYLDNNGSFSDEDAPHTSRKIQQQNKLQQGSQNFDLSEEDVMSLHQERVSRVSERNQHARDRKRQVMTKQKQKEEEIGFLDRVKLAFGCVQRENEKKASYNDNNLPIRRRHK